MRPLRKLLSNTCDINNVKDNHENDNDTGFNMHISRKKTIVTIL